MIANEDADVLLIDEKNGTVLYRQRQEGGETVLRKRLLSAEASSNVLRHEYHILCSIDRKLTNHSDSSPVGYVTGIPHIISPISLIRSPVAPKSSQGDISLASLDDKATSTGFLILTLEDVNGRSLRSAFLSTSIQSSQNLFKPCNIPLGLFLSIAYQLSLAIETVHESSLLHRGLTPDSILISDAFIDTGLIDRFVQIVDFSSAIYLDKGSSINGSYQTTSNINYISPEQTGRMNRMVDYRSDFYSLGAILYELITGSLPLEGKDTLAFFHALIARVPVPAHLRNQKIPFCIGAILSKLLEKSPESRYQSARGLRNDIVALLTQMKKECIRTHHPVAQRLHGDEEIAPYDIPILCSISDSEITQLLEDMKTFVPGNNDPSFKTLLISSKLYGRRQELQILKQAFMQCVQKEKVSIVTVRGPAGCGKTRFINELQSLATEYRGFWCYQKFDLSYDSGANLIHNPQKPFFDLQQCSEEALKKIQVYLRKNLDDTQVHLLKAVNPDFLSYYGTPPPIAADWHSKISPPQMKKLYAKAWNVFLRGLTCAGPIIMVFDDIQWADPAVIDIINDTIPVLSEMPIIYVISYKENEMEQSNGLFQLLSTSKDAGRPVFEIALGDLHVDDVRSILSDTLKTGSENVDDLLSIIMKATSGNALHIHTFLKELYLRNNLSLNIDPLTKEQKWTWCLDCIMRANIGRSVIELMANQLKTNLQEETVNLIIYAAAIGLTFDLQTLAKLVKKPLLEVAELLWPAVEAQYILSIGDHHRLILQSRSRANLLNEELDITDPIIEKFVHDRVQTSAYEMLPTLERPRVHLMIARVLYETAKPEDLSSKIFLILNHYEKGFREALNELAVSEETDALVFAELCYQAALSAKKTGSFGLAKKYLKMALKILTHGLSIDEAWVKHYNLMLKIVHIRTYVSAGSGEITDTYKYYESIRKHGKCIADKLSAAPTEFSGYLATFSFDKAMKQAKGDLELFKVDPPRTPDAAFAEVKNLFGNRTTQEIISDIDALTSSIIPRCDDGELCALFETLSQIMTISFRLQHEHLTYWASALFITKVFADRKFHNGLCKALLYLGAGVLISENSIRKKVLSLYERIERDYPFQDVPAKLTCDVLLIKLYKNTMRRLEMEETISHLLSKSLEIGFMSVTTYCAFAALNNKIEWSTPIPEILKWCDRFTNIFAALGEESLVNWKMALQVLKDMRDDSRITPADTSFKIPRLTLDSPAQAHMLVTFNVTIGGVFGDFEEMSKVRKLYMQRPLASKSHHALFFAINYADDPTVPLVEKLLEFKQFLLAEKALLENVEDEVQYFRFNIILAEQARLMENEETMLVYYEKANDLCAIHGLLMFQGLIEERLAKYWISRQHVRYKHMICLHLQEAAKHFMHWGAYAKVQQLEVHYPQYMKSSPRGKHAHISSRPTPDSSSRKTSDSQVNFDDELRIHTSFALEKEKSSEKTNSLSRRGTAPKIICSPPSTLFRRSTDDSLGHFGGLTQQQIDVATLLKATHMIANETNLENIIRELIFHTAVNVGATKAVLILKDSDGLYMVQATFEDGHVLGMLNKPLYSTTEEVPMVPLTIMDKVTSTGRHIILEDATRESEYSQDVYICRQHPVSIMSVPILQKKVVMGIIYIENNLTPAAFSEERMEIVISLAAAAAISIENSRLQKVNTELRSALNSQHQSDNFPIGHTPRYIVDGPIKSALDSIKEIIIANPKLKGELKKVVEVLVSGHNAFTANIDSIQDETGKGIDSDTKDWLRVTTQMVGEPAKDRRFRLRRSSFTGVRPVTFSELSNGNLNRCLQDYNTPHFNVFELNRLSDGAPLSVLGPYIINESLGLSSKLGLSPKKISNYFKAIEASYQQVPYHNSAHGADVMQTTLMLLTTQPQISGIYSSNEMFAAIISGAAHDADHPGLNNNYMIQTQDHLALLYSDQSVLENHHSATCFSVALSDEESNIFSGLSPESFKDIRKTIIQMILATDMAKHFEYINKFKARILTKTATSVAGPSGFFPDGLRSPGPLPFDDTLDKQLILDVAIKCADLSNPAKKPEIAVKWTEAIMKEFFVQGDLEHAKGLPISKFMDRKEPNVPKCQIGFIDVLVSPLYDIWRIAFGPTPFNTECIDNITNNRKFWDNMLLTQRLTSEEAMQSIYGPIAARLIDEQEDSYPQDNKKSKKFAI